MLFEAYLSLSFSSLLGVVVAGIGLMIATAGGVSGGGILVPIYITAWSLPIHLSIPLSSVTLFGGACAHYLLNVFRKHPSVLFRPLIDYDVALMLTPTVIMGSIFGVLFNKLLPTWMICISLSFLCIFITWRTYLKWRLLTVSENIMQWEKNAVLAYKRSSSIPLILYENTPMAIARRKKMQEKGDEDERNSYGTFYPHSNLKTQMELHDTVRSEEGVMPVLKVTYLLFIHGGVLAMVVGRGILEWNPYNVVCGSWTYIILLLLGPMIWLFFHFLCIRQLLISEYRTKLRLEYPFVEGSVRWNAINTLKYPLVRIIVS